MDFEFDYGPTITCFGLVGLSMISAVLYRAATNGICRSDATHTPTFLEARPLPLVETTITAKSITPESEILAIWPDDVHELENTPDARNLRINKTASYI